MTDEEVKLNWYAIAESGASMTAIHNLREHYSEVIAELKAKLEESEVFIENIVKASADNPNEFFELRKENKELKEHIKEVENDSTNCEIWSYETINKLKAQIEKMKCCGNCINHNDLCYCELDRKEVNATNVCDKWEWEKAE